eukprot:TRINITY_DN93920_c0_g1_i1.p1 TRINITY_DN93920_c0_g1~~TRINITY_DN93920_c0_g1_i1.p1  ORF type:complete len:600 (+),score=65.70 TRINITY_DN93920_c0_g1_i1:69-1868(+)
MNTGVSVSSSSSPSDNSHEASSSSTASRTHTLDVLTEETSKINFSNMMLHPDLVKGMTEAGFLHPSPIQLRAIPLGKLGIDVIGQAKSGTGKTLVFSVVILEMLNLKSTTPQALVLSPTREIAIQSCQVIQTVGKYMKGLAASCFVGGENRSNDKRRGRESNVIVGTPGRVKDLICNGDIKTDSVRLFVLDEADQIVGVYEEMRVDCTEIFRKLPERKQTCCFSATYPKKALATLKKFMRDPQMVNVCNPDESALKGVKEFYKTVEKRTTNALLLKVKLEELVGIMQRIPFHQSVVFCNESAFGEQIAADLTSRHIPACFICGSLPQATRTRVMSQFTNLQVRVLVSTDLTARGIDMTKVSLVVNLDVPPTAATYVHRTGRTGRFGTLGITVSVLTEEELVTLKKYRRVSGFETELEALPDDFTAEDLQYYNEISVKIKPTENSKPPAKETKKKPKKPTTVAHPTTPEEEEDPCPGIQYEAGGEHDSPPPGEADGAEMTEEEWAAGVVAVQQDAGNDELDEEFDAGNVTTLPTPVDNQVGQLHFAICKYYDDYYKDQYQQAVKKLKVSHRLCSSGRTPFVGANFISPFRDYARELQPEL